MRERESEVRQILGNQIILGLFFFKVVDTIGEHAGTDLSRTASSRDSKSDRFHGL